MFLTFFPMQKFRTEMRDDVMLGAAVFSAAESMRGMQWANH
jgi:hypothetical protein